jgi:hypothetical protein
MKQGTAKFLGVRGTARLVSVTPYGQYVETDTSELIPAEQETYHLEITEEPADLTLRNANRTKSTVKKSSLQDQPAT